MQPNHTESSDTHESLTPPVIVAVGIALLLFLATLWGPEDVRRVLYIGTPSLLVLIIFRQWLSAAENQEISKHLQQQLLDFNFLLESGRVIVSQIRKHKIEDLYATTVRIAHGLVHADVVALPICNGDGTFTYVESFGRMAEIMKGHTLPLSQGGLCGWVATHQRPLVVADLLNDPRIIREMAEQLEVTTAVVVPILEENEVIGAISAFRRGKPFTNYDAQILSIFAHEASIAFHNAVTYAALENRLKELNLAQAQLIQAEKMAAVGQLVSGVAHELNNPLTSILGFSEILKEQSNIDEESKRDLDRIYAEADRARQIIQNLLQFSRADKPSREWNHVNKVLARTLALREYQLKINNVELIKDLGTNIPSSMMDSQELAQVFLNILINAEQAILDTGKGGRITVSTRLSRPDEILISFRDSGPGISKEQLPKIFEPFFTTKEVGRGTGLGLSLSYGIIKQHGGTIRAESKPGEGSEFLITLPISPA